MSVYSTSSSTPTTSQHFEAAARHLADAAAELTNSLPDLTDRHLAGVVAKAATFSALMAGFLEKHARKLQRKSRYA